MAEDEPASCRTRNQEEEVEMDRAHLTKTKNKHHKTVPDVETTRQKEKGETLKTPGEENWRQTPKRWGTPGKSWRNCTGPRTLEKSCRWPMLREG